ncbi:single-stranded DNA-binding protein [Clostridium niameyense]|uniref:Single-stranded DNA-binding protein n=1 Tax=Clostridium niameyense TaxID=1622073 RepID=A0A6M0RC57_9CLOT|nr:ERF family protein [Clostridium niameyense]NEZ47836.1 single-stranded DNA-binding protein [Clostridium niameyense]
MSVYKKLADARVKLQEEGLKKSGKNKFAGYEYFELEDFLPSINKINKQVGLCTIVKFSIDIATLIIVDVDEPDNAIEITSPMKSATLKGCHEIQNLGAVESYQRRYLYMTAYEIAESDLLDGTTGKDTPSKQNGNKSKLTDNQLKRLYAIANNVGINADTVKSHVMTKFKKEVTQMNKKEYDTVCNGYEKMAKKGE